MRHLTHIFSCSIISLLILRCTVADVDGSSEKAELLAEAHKERWVVQALEVIKIADETSDSLVLKTEISTGTTANWYLNNERRIYKMELQSNEGTMHQFYFENGQLTFSQHEAMAVGQPKSSLVAYAQNKPYLSARGDNIHTLSQSELNSLPISNMQMDEIVKIGNQLQNIERGSNGFVRLSANQSVVNDKIIGSSRRTYLVNLQRGDKITIDLESANSHLFFTIAPDNGSDMERRNWRGTMERTGDLKIKVFSSEPVEHESFTLRIKRESQS